MERIKKISTFVYSSYYCPRFYILCNEFLSNHFSLCDTPGTYSANANMAPKQVALSSIWAVVVVYFFGSLAYNGVQGGMLSSSFSRTMELLGVNN